MNIESIPSSNQTTSVDIIKATDDSLRSVDEALNIENKKIYSGSVKSPFDTEIQNALDKATGLMQTIVSDKITDEVIRKMPSDEYLHLLSLLDHLISGSIDKEV